MDIPDEFLCGLIDEDAIQLELALKYAAPEETDTTPKEKEPIRERRLAPRKKKRIITLPESEWKYPCLICMKLFPTHMLMNKHRNNAHLTAKYECPVCKKKFTRRDVLKDHETIHSDKTFNCKRCHKLFRQYSCLRQHERKHEKEDEKQAALRKMNKKPKKPKKQQSENRSNSPKLGTSLSFQFNIEDLEDDNVTRHPDLVFTTEKNELEPFQNLNQGVLENNKNNDQPFLCEKCYKLFPTDEKLRKHLRNAHLSGKYSCPVCDKLFTRKDLCRDHITTHTGEKKFKCSYKKCKKSFHMIICLRQHEKLHTRKRKRTDSNSSSESEDDMSESDENRCCSKPECVEKDEPKEAIVITAPPNPVQEVEVPKPKEASVIEVNTNPGQEFIEEDPEEMELALQLGIPENIAVNDEPVPEPDEVDEEDDELEGFWDDDDEEEEPGPEPEEEEEEEEREEFICFHCFEKFDSHEDMLLHIENEHFTFACETCNKQFPTDKRLKKHQRDAHLSGKFRCPICDKLFTRKDLCKDHVYTHSQKPLFKCKYDNCEKTFSKPYSLKQHEKIHSDSNRRNCPICNESVVQLSKHLNRHLKTKQYPCGSCDKSFTRLSYLNEHEKIHLGETGFVCDECHVEFKSSNVLYKHKRSKHAKEKYVCEVSGCGQEFNRKDNMTTHMRRVHKLKVETVRNRKNDSEHDGIM